MKKKYALESTVNNGLLCKDGAGNYIVSTEYHTHEKYSGLLKVFDTKDEADNFIREKEFYALRVTEVDGNNL